VVGPDGKAYKLSIPTIKRDGKPYPVVGSLSINTLAYTRVMSNMALLTGYKDGKPAIDYVQTVSADGKTMTLISRSYSDKGELSLPNIAVYDRK